jgi:diguanylate cyclase (GGDEF)-like protein
MLPDPPAFRPPQAEDFLIEAPSQISAETLCFRSAAINAILRAHLLRQGLPLDEALGQLFDLASEAVFYDGGFAFFCEEQERQMRLRLVRDVRRALEGERLSGVNLLNYWTAKYWRPFLLRAGQHPQIDGLLRGIGAGCVVAVPLFAGNRPRGVLQLFGVDPECFAALDAQLLWILALAAERLFPGAAQSPAAATHEECEERLQRELARAERHQRALSLLLLGIDRFQLITDIYGREVAEAIQNEVLSVLGRGVRGLDSVRRYGNGEFAVVLPDTTTAGAYCVAERIKQDLEQARFSVDTPSSGIRLTVSIGLAVYPADAQSARELLQAAGWALSEARHNSRGGIAVNSELQEGGREPAGPVPKVRELPREQARPVPARPTSAVAGEPERAARAATPPMPASGAEAKNSEPAAPAWMQLCDFRELTPAAPASPPAAPPAMPKEIARPVAAPSSPVAGAEAKSSEPAVPAWMQLCDFRELAPAAPDSPPARPKEISRPAAPPPPVAATRPASSEAASPAWMHLCDFRELASPAPALPKETVSPAQAEVNLAILAPPTVAPADKPPVPALPIPVTGEASAKAAAAADAAILPQQAQTPRPPETPAAPAAAEAEPAKDVPSPPAVSTPAPPKTAPAVAAPKLVPKPAIAETKVYSGQRREQRLEIALPVQVWGMDANGELFEQNAITVDITTIGAQLKGITHRLERGCVVGIKHQASKARFRVKWVGAEGTPSEGYIGVRLLDEGKLIWGRALRRVLGDDFTVGFSTPGLRPN